VITGEICLAPARQYPRSDQRKISCAFIVAKQYFLEHDAGEFIEIKNPSVDESERSFIFFRWLSICQSLIRIWVMRLC